MLSFTGFIKKRRAQTAFMLALAALLAGCVMPFHAVTGTPMPAAVTALPHEPATSAPEATVPTVTNTPVSAAEPGPAAAVDPAEICPEAAEDTALYIDADNGFCLLAPSDFAPRTFQEYRYDRIEFTQPETAGASPQRIAASLVIEVNGNAGEQNSRGYAKRWISNFIPQQETELVNTTLGGRDAAQMLFETEFGPLSEAVFVTAYDVKYRFLLTPAAGSVPELEPVLRNLWDTAAGSLVFFPPQAEQDYTTPEEVCPSAGPGFEQYINFSDGYCLLYPSDFEPTDKFAGDFKGGPVLDTADGVGEVKASITVGTYGPNTGATAMELLEERMDVIDQDSVEDTTIMDYPAVTFRDPRGPWASRQAMIQANGHTYTLVNQPYEPERYPEGMPYVEAIWESVITSLAFFDPWR